MHILCTICSDLVNQAENIYVTKCGHIFHYSCLAQWIARSKSCPQCRNKVTERCMFRLYPTISNENTTDDVTTLRSQLDDAQLQLRQQRASEKENEEKLASVTAALKKQQELLKDLEKKLVSRESAVSTLKQQLEYVNIQNRETHKLREENDRLSRNIQTLNGLQKVLNATSDEVEQMLGDYADVRTIATFATALKRALCESEGKKNESRDQLQALKQQLLNEKNTVADLQAKLLEAETRLSRMERKRKSQSLDVSMGDDSWAAAVKHMRPSDEGFNDDAVLNDTDSSFNTLVSRIEQAPSPHPRQGQGGAALAARAALHGHIKPSGFAIPNSTKNPVTNNPTSIFYKKEELKIDFGDENLDLSQDMFYDGLGGHCKLDTFPAPRARPPARNVLPRLSAKHKLKRPNPTSNVSITKMFEKMQNGKK